MKPYYQHAGITIYHADCREVLPHITQCDLLLTDPPYGIGFAAQPPLYQRMRGLMPKPWDDKPIEPDLIGMVLGMGSSQIIWGGNYYHLPISRGWLAWIKPDGPPSFSRLELAWSNLDICSRYIVHTVSATNAERVGHPTQKPMAVMRWCLTFTPDAKSLIDPFCGSGTSLVAAKDAGLKAVGVEISEEYCEIAAKRLSQEVLDFSAEVSS